MFAGTLTYPVDHPDGAGQPTFAGAAGCKLGKDGGQGVTASRIALRWLPTDNVEVNLSGDYTYERETAPGGVLLYARPQGDTLNGVPYGCAFVPTGPNSCDTILHGNYAPI